LANGNIKIDYVDNKLIEIKCGTFTFYIYSTDE